METGSITILIETERSNIQNNIFAIVMHMASPDKGNWGLKKMAVVQVFHFSYLSFFFLEE